MLVNRFISDPPDASVVINSLICTSCGYSLCCAVLLYSNKQQRQPNSAPCVPFYSWVPSLILAFGTLCIKGLLSLLVVLPRKCMITVNWGLYVYGEDTTGLSE